MGRRRRQITYHYCPKCSRKTLSQWTYRHTGKSFWKCKNRKCRLRIEHEDRDADIKDYYGGVLDVVARFEERIPDYFLQSETRVYRKGFEVLFEGEHLFVVRHRHRAHGVSVGLYWKADTVEEDVDGVLNPMKNSYLFTHPATKEMVLFRGKSLVWLLNRYGSPTILWKKDGDSRFKGSLNKTLREKIISWSTSLDEEIPGLIETAEAKVDEWEEKKGSIEKALEGTGASVENFDGHKKYCVKIKLRSITLDEAAQINEILSNPLEINLIRNEGEGGSHCTVEQARAVADMLGITNLTVKVDIDRWMSPEKAEKIAAVLAPAEVGVEE